MLLARKLHMVVCQLGCVPRKGRVEELIGVDDIHCHLLGRGERFRRPMTSSCLVPIKKQNFLALKAVVAPGGWHRVSHAGCD